MEIIKNNIDIYKPMLSLLKMEENLHLINILRDENENTALFSRLSVFKDYVLDIARLVEAESINDIYLLCIKEKEFINIADSGNMVLLCLNNHCVFKNDKKEITPKTGDLVFINSRLDINNHTDINSYLLLVEFKELTL